MSNWKPHARRIKVIAALVGAFCFADAPSSAGAEAGPAKVTNMTAQTDRFAGSKGGSVLVTGPSSFWSNNATNATMGAGGMQTNRGALRLLPGTGGDGGVTVTGKVLQIITGFTNNPSGGPVNAGLLRALGSEVALDAAQTLTNVGMIVVSNVSSGPVAAPTAGNAFSVGAALINANGVIRVGRGGQFVLGSAVTNRAGGVTQSNSAPLLKLSQDVTNFGAISVLGPSTAIHSGILLLGPSGIISVPNTEPRVGPAR